MLWCVLLRLGWPSKSSTASTPTRKFESCHPSERLRLIPFWLLAAYLSHLAFSNKHFLLLWLLAFFVLLRSRCFWERACGVPHLRHWHGRRWGPFCKNLDHSSSLKAFGIRQGASTIPFKATLFLHNSLATSWPTDLLSFVQSTGCFRDRASCGWLWGGMQIQAPWFSMAVPWLWGRSGRICCGAAGSLEPLGCGHSWNAEIDWRCEKTL